MGQTAKERQSRQVVRLQVKKEAKYGKEGKEKREWEKRDVGCWLGAKEKRGHADLA